MAPRPYENNFRVRLSKTGTTPAIYAISSGPQKGVHMLSSEPLEPALQYLYRHPINLHPSFLDISGDFLRRRFDTIAAAQSWIDEMDALRRRTEATSSLTSPSSPSEEDLATRLTESLSLAPTPLNRAERRRDPVWKTVPESVWASGIPSTSTTTTSTSLPPSLSSSSSTIVRVGNSAMIVPTGVRAASGGFRVGKRYAGVAAKDTGAGRYSRSHTGVARREVVGVLTRRFSEADVSGATAAVARVGLAEAGGVGGGGGGGCLGPEVAMED